MKRTLLLLLIVIGLLLRLYTIGDKSIWLDEAFSIWLANQPLTDLFGWLIQIDQHPPLYYTLLSLWQTLFGDQQGTVRLISALASTLTIPFFYHTAHRLFDENTALVATLLLALAPFHVQYAQETRMYALLTLLVAIALYLLTRMLLDPVEEEPRWLWPAFGVAQATVMLTHNTAAVFFPMALNLAIGSGIVWSRWRREIISLPVLNHVNFVRRWMCIQGLALLCWLPWSVPFVIQTVGVDRSFWLSYPTWRVVYATLHNFHLAHLPGAMVPWPIADALYWGLAALGIWRLRRRGALLGLLLAIFLVPIVGTLLVSLRRPIFLERTLIWVTLPYYVLVAVGIIQLRSGIVYFVDVTNRLIGGGHEIRRSAKKMTQLGRLAEPYTPTSWHGQRWLTTLIPGVILIVMVSLNLLALNHYYHRVEKEAWDVAATYVAERIQPDDLLLFNASWTQLPFDYYFRRYVFDDGFNVERRGFPVDLFDRSVLEPQMTPADLPRLTTLLAGYKDVWLIYSHESYTDPDSLISRELHKERQIVETVQLRGLRIIHFAERDG